MLFDQRTGQRLLKILDISCDMDWPEGDSSPSHATHTTREATGSLNVSPACVLVPNVGREEFQKRVDECGARKSVGRAVKALSWRGTGE